MVQTQQSNSAEPSFQSKVGAIIRKELLQILDRLDVLLRDELGKRIEEPPSPPSGLWLVVRLHILPERSQGIDRRAQPLPHVHAGRGFRRPCLSAKRAIDPWASVVRGDCSAPVRPLRSTSPAFSSVGRRCRWAQKDRDPGAAVILYPRPRRAPARGYRVSMGASGLACSLALLSRPPGQPLYRPRTGALAQGHHHHHRRRSSPPVRVWQDLNDGDEIIEIEERISLRACPETNDPKDPVMLS